MAVNAPADTVTLTINGKEVNVPKGVTVLQAANMAGIEIPTLCNHEILEPVGACRMCVVEIAPGPPRPMASCTTPAANGMTVKTDTDEMQRIRPPDDRTAAAAPPARLPLLRPVGHLRAPG